MSGSGQDGGPDRPSFASAHQLRSARLLLRRKERTAARRFLAEGPQAVREALASGRVEVLFVAQPSLARHQVLVEAAVAAGIDVRLGTETAVSVLSDTVTPQGLVAVCRTFDVSLAEAITSQARLVVACAQIRDPGNAGTVIRCADAFGADAVIFTEGSVDAYNAKTVRASAGSLFHLPVALGASLEATAGRARTYGLQVLAADGHGDVELDALSATGELTRPTLWLLGNEAWGLPGSQREVADRVVRVPLYGAAESLNLSTAAAVCLYASASAQRAGSQP